MPACLPFAAAPHCLGCGCVSVQPCLAPPLQMPKEFDGYFKREDPWELGPLIPHLQAVGALPTPWPAAAEEQE